MKSEEYFVRCIHFDYLNLVNDNTNKHYDINERNSVSIWQKFKSDESGVIWDASLFMAKYIEYQCYLSNKRLTNCNVIELGTGTGFLGIWFAALGAQVLLTDLNLELIKVNVEKNQSWLNDSKQIEIKSFDWQDETMFEWNFLNWKSLNQIDYVLISDCLYYEKGMLALYKFIEWFFDEIFHMTQPENCSQTKQVQMLISYEEREDKMEICNRFLNKIKQNVRLKLEFINDEQLHPDYRSNDLHLLRIMLS